jgi:ribosome-binding factor A
MSVRTEKVGAMIRDALGVQLQRNLPDYLDGMVTVVSVKMSPDIRIAKVYVSIFRSKTPREILVKRLNTHMPEIRKELARNVDMKYVPELRFYLDDTLDAAEHIDKLLKAVRKDSPSSGSEESTSQ